MPETVQFREATEPIESQRELAERRDRAGVWIRRFAMCVLAAVVVVALFNVVGQRATTASTGNPLADLTVHSPTALRPGLLFQAKITVTAHEPLPDAQLVLSHDWIDGLTLNTEEPGASTELSGPGGSLILDLGALKADQTFVQYLDFQVNPTSDGRRSQIVTLRSQGAAIVSVHRATTIIP